MSMENQVSTSPVLSFVSRFACLFAYMCACLVLLLATGLLTNSAKAEDVVHCSLELDDKKRAACFESNPQQRYEQRMSGWPILKLRSYATGNDNASATRNAEQYAMCRDTEITTSIGLHCSDDGLKVVFSMGCNFGESNKPTTIELHTAANASGWTGKVLRNRLGMTIDDAILASRFMKSMQGQSSAVLVFAPEDAPKFTASFDLTGYDKAAAKIEELCQP